MHFISYELIVTNNSVFIEISKLWGFVQKLTWLFELHFTKKIHTYCAYFDVEFTFAIARDLQKSFNTQAVALHVSLMIFQDLFKYATFLFIISVYVKIHIRIL